MRVSATPVARRHGRTRAGLLLATTMLVPVMAHAQVAAAQDSTAGVSGTGGAVAASGSSNQVDEIIVTATKRAENLQSVPIAITALSTQKLEQLQVNNFNDYVKYLPSVSYTSFGPGQNQVFIRGVASGETVNHSASLPSVGTYLDEQPVTTIQGALDIHIYDVARVETLSGPQGTLYGASSEAGTIRIITNKPEIGVLKGAVDTEVNSIDHGNMGYVGEGFVNLPVNDKMAVRLVGWYDHEGGYIDNVAGSRTFPAAGVTVDNAEAVKNNYNDVTTYGGRAALRIELNDNWTVTPTVIAQETKSNGIFAYEKSLGDLKVSHKYPEKSKDRWIQAGLTIEGKIGSVDVTYAGSYLKRTFDQQSDYSDYSYFYDTLAGYTLQNDAGDNINPSQHITGRDKFTKQSHELRFTTDKDSRLRAVGGLFYQRQTDGIFQDYLVDGLATELSVPGYADTLWLTQQKRIDRDYAAFGEITYDIVPDHLIATAGGRVFRYDNSLVGFFGFGEGYSSHTGVAACFGPAIVSGSPCTNLDKSAKKTGFTHRLNLTYKFDPDHLVYATWSRGFRPGGINRRGTFPAYKPDYLTNYEVGFKTSWFDNSLRFNGDLYYLDWKGIQFSFLGENGLTNIQNAQSAHIKGAEANIEYVPIKGMSLTLAGAYTDAKLAEPFCTVPFTTNCPAATADGTDNPVAAPDGTRLPTTPKFKGTGTARYEWAVASFTAHVQGTLTYQTNSWNDLRTVDREILGRRPGYALVDGNAGVNNGSWSLEAFVKNAFDKRPDIYRYAECISTVCGGQIYTFTAQPRTIGLRAGTKF